MFYIVESDDQLLSLSNYLESTKKCFVYAIGNNDNFHPKLQHTVAVYIKPVSSSFEDGFIVPINHSEGLNVGKERVSELLRKCEVIYTDNRKNLLYHFNLPGIMDLSLIHSMKTYKRFEAPSRNETVNRYYSTYPENTLLNEIIPISKLFEDCENLYNSLEIYCYQEIPSGFEFYNFKATNVFFMIEQTGLSIYKNVFDELFKPTNPLFNTQEDGTILTQYNLYNATSRPTNTYNSVNFAAIPKSEEYRKCFKPQNDYFVEFDFDGYHLRLLSNQIDYPLTPESAHKQLAKLYFGKDEITDEEYIQAKQINFHAIYGKIPEEHKNLPIFKSIQEYIDVMWRMFKDDGVVYNPQSGKAFTEQLTEMHPAKLMNYMMQSLETSNNVVVLAELLKYLQGKKTKIALYTYDAILFDFNKDDGKETLVEIERIMSSNEKHPVKFKHNTNLVL